MGTAFFHLIKQLLDPFYKLTITGYELSCFRHLNSKRTMFRLLRLLRLRLRLHLPGRFELSAIKPFLLKRVKSKDIKQNVKSKITSFEHGKRFQNSRKRAASSGKPSRFRRVGAVAEGP